MSSAGVQVKSKRAIVRENRLTPDQLAEVRRKNGAKGGRPKGIVESKTRRRVNEILAQNGETPVDVMFDNMLYWHRKVRVLNERFEELMGQASDAIAGGGEEALQAMKELSATASKFLYARERSQSCAVDAAQYCHPKLQAIAIQQKNTHEVKVIGGLPMMPEEAPVEASG